MKEGKVQALKAETDSTECENQNEKTDQFWESVTEHISGNKTKKDVMSYFNALDYSDKVRCYQNLRKRLGVDFITEMRDNINQSFVEIATQIGEQSKVEVKCCQESPLIYKFTCAIYFQYEDYRLHKSGTVRLKTRHGIMQIEDLEKIGNLINSVGKQREEGSAIIEEVEQISKLQYIEKIVPLSHLLTELEMNDVIFIIEYKEKVYNRYNEFITGTYYELASRININKVRKNYKKCHQNSIVEMDRFLMMQGINNNSVFQSVIKRLDSKVESFDCIRLRINYDETGTYLIRNGRELCKWEFHGVISGFEEDMEKFFEEKIEVQSYVNDKIQEAISRINCCKNGLWKAENKKGIVIITLCDPVTHQSICSVKVEFDEKNNIRRVITDTMISLLDYAENYLGIRFIGGKLIG